MAERLEPTLAKKYIQELSGKSSKSHQPQPLPSFERQISTNTFSMGRNDFDSKLNSTFVYEVVHCTCFLYCHSMNFVRSYDDV